MRAEIARASVAAPLFALVLSALAVAPTLAADPKTAPPATSGKPPATAPQGQHNNDLAEGSPVAGFKFGDKPFILADAGDFQDFMQKVAREQGRNCDNLESYGWILKKDDQRRVDGLQGSIIGSLKKLNYRIAQIKPKTVKSEDVQVFVADQAAKRLMLSLVLAPESLILLICDTTSKK